MEMPVRRWIQLVRGILPCLWCAAEFIRFWIEDGVRLNRLDKESRPPDIGSSTL
jgi:hypothetical protein